MDDIVATFERRAERGVARGAASVLRSARALIDHDHVVPVDASIAPRPRRPLLIAAAVLAVLLVGAAAWKLTTGSESSDRVVTTPATDGNAATADRFSLRLVTGTTPPPCAPGTMRGSGALACFELGAPIVGGDEVANAYVGRRSGNSWDVLIDLTPDGLRIFNLTAARVAPGTKVAVVVDGIVRAAPVFQETVSSITVTDPSLTEATARELAARIRAAAGGPASIVVLRDACDYLTQDDLERLGVRKASLPDDPTRCGYVGDAATSGDPVPTLGITLRTRSEPTDALPSSDGNQIVQEIGGLAAPAAWITLNPTGVPPTAGQSPTPSTALGTPNPTSGRLVVKPRGMLLEVASTGMHNNLEEAKGAAQLILARL
jgi:SecDF, P1 head subdomain